MWPIIIFVIAAFGELYFFLMQRSALQICRATGLPEQSRFLLLPPYYKASWLFIAAKWGAVIALVVQGHWLLALIFILASYLVGMVIPVPHQAFFEIFYRDLQEDRPHVPAEARAALNEAIESVDRKHQITDRFRA